jgi:DNA-binding NtrC family response regulator
MVEELLRNSHPTSGAISSNQELRDAEVRTIMSALSATKWNRRRAAEVLGVSYSALRRRISKYNLEKSECTWQAQSGHRAAGLWDGC